MSKIFKRISRVVYMILLLTGFYYAIAAEEEKGFKFVERDRADADVYFNLNNISNSEVSKRLFGKFSENLGRNIYGGIWADILENPSLEPASVCYPFIPYHIHQRAEYKKMTKKDLPLDEYEEKHLPFKWFKWNVGDNEVKFSSDCFNTSNSVSLELKSLSRDIIGAGIRQPVYLPIHREKKYDVSMFVKNASAPIVILIKDIKDNGRIFAQRIIQPPASSGDWVKVKAQLSLKIGKSMEGKPLWFCVGLASKGAMLIDQVRLTPADAIDGFDPDVVRLLREEKISILRFPGGNYVSGYHWKDDLIDVDKRPTRQNPAWWEIDPHHVGTDDYIKFCRLIGAEPMICVNAGNGTPEEAADWIEYCNGDASTKWGSERIKRGFVEPYNVKVWEIGNELWGDWQIGHCNSEEYAERYRKFYNAMHKTDPTVLLLATGNPMPDVLVDWNKVLVEKCPDIVNTLTLHFLCGNNPLSTPEFSYLSQMGYSYQFEDFFRTINDLGKSKGLNLKAALTEEMIYTSRAYHPKPESLAEALFYAGTLNSAIRTEGMVEIFTHSAILNHGGNMIKERGQVYPSPVYYALQGLEEISSSSPIYFKTECQFLDIPDWQAAWEIAWLKSKSKKYPMIDIMPLKKDDKIYIVIINRSPDKMSDVKLHIEKADIKKRFDVFELSGNSFMDMNDFANQKRVKPMNYKEKLGEKNLIVFKTKPSSLYLLELRINR